MRWRAETRARGQRAPRIAVGCQSRGSRAQQRGKRRELAFTPFGGCQPAGSPGWKGPRGDARSQAGGSGRALALKTEQTASWPTLDAWSAEQEELLKNHVISYPLPESQGFSKCTHIWDFSNNVPDFMFFTTYFLALLRFSHEATYQLCLLTS